MTGPMGFRVVLVDEYQDSNLLQEQIYFTLCQRSGAALTVVGDDDQSLYRFRGATVEIFTEFPKRYAEFFGQPAPAPIFLNTNYRQYQALSSSSSTTSSVATCVPAGASCRQATHCRTSQETWAADSWAFFETPSRNWRTRLAIS